MRCVTNILLQQTQEQSVLYLILSATRVFRYITLLSYQRYVPRKDRLLSLTFSTSVGKNLDCIDSFVSGWYDIDTSDM